ncbi:MAG: site-specific integrase [Schwartzia sp.]|nr:site-specific integrase [Schwartzia sp. (in: firmicutes)]
MEPNGDFMIGSSQRMDGNESLSAKSKVRLHRSKSDNTLRAYHADWNDFADWCRYHDVTALPATPETIVNYLNDLTDVDATVKANTVARRVTAISENHIAAGYDRERNPAKDSLVRATLSAIRRERGTFQHGKAPILYETLYLLADCFEGKDDIASLRDRALLFLGFAGAFRRSELVNVRLEDLTFGPQGLTVFIPRAKGDQLGKGSTIAIPYAPEPSVCAVRAVKAWIEAADLHTGPLFHPITKTGTLRPTQLSDKSVALTVKKYVAMAGLDPAEFAGHSLRRGFATSAAQHNADSLSIMRQTRHKSEKMVHRYIEQGNLFKETPLNRIYND